MKIYTNCDQNPITWNKEDYLLEAQKRMGLSVFEEWKGQECDYLLNIQPCEIKAGKKWTGLWHIDVLLDSPFPMQYGAVDTVFVSSSQMKHPYEKAHVLFQALDPVLHRRYPEIEQDVDIVLCGSMGTGVYDMRQKAYFTMGQHFKVLNVDKDKRPWEYVKAINRAKVQFIRSGTSSEGMGAIAQRFFECLGIGPVLVNWTDDILLTGLIENEDFMAYRNDDEMIEKMRLLLGDEGLRKKIFENGRNKALHYHSYENRIGAILNEVYEHDPAFTAF